MGKLLHISKNMLGLNAIYNIRTFKIEAECKNIADACRLLKDKHGHVTEGNLIRNRYIVSRTKFSDVNELRNYINEKILLAKSSYGKYAILKETYNISELLLIVLEMRFLVKVL